MTSGRKLWTRRFEGDQRFIVDPRDDSFWSIGRKLFHLEANTGELKLTREMPASEVEDLRGVRADGVTMALRHDRQWRERADGDPVLVYDVGAQRTFTLPCFPDRLAPPDRPARVVGQTLINNTERGMVTPVTLMTQDGKTIDGRTTSSDARPTARFGSIAMCWCCRARRKRAARSRCWTAAAVCRSGSRFCRTARTTRTSPAESLIAAISLGRRGCHRRCVSRRHRRLGGALSARSPEWRNPRAHDAGERARDDAANDTRWRDDRAGGYDAMIGVPTDAVLQRQVDGEHEALIRKAGHCWR
jgi:hypothetical protein